MRSLTTEQWDRVWALVSRLGVSPTNARARALEALRQGGEEPAVLAFVGLHFRIPPEHNPLAPGCRVGKYEIVRRLGAGGMGVVYEAIQDEPRRDVALKVINWQLNGPEAIALFRQEIQRQGELRHVGIVPVYEGGPHTDSRTGTTLWYFTMDLIHGTPLLRHVRERRSDLAARVKLMIPVCEAVQYAHDRLVIHADLKPDHVLIDRSQSPRLLDFGLARLVDAALGHLSDAEVLPGTPAYMAPEHVSRAYEPRLSFATDVYALGLILYELVAGHRPYEVPLDSLEGMQKAILEAEPPPLNEVVRQCPAALAGVIARCLRKTPSARYPSAGHLGEELRGWYQEARRRKLFSEVGRAGPPHSSAGTRGDGDADRRDAPLDLHRVKDPAESWYVQRTREEAQLGGFLEDVPYEPGQNFLITGASGIGKSSFLNRAEAMAREKGLLPVKLRVFGTDFDSFLQQMVDEVLRQLNLRDVVQHHPRNHLLAVLGQFRYHNQTPLVLLIDQFERLFEESRVRIDELLMREVWRKFSELAREVNELGGVSFVITARQHFFWVMFPSDGELEESRFRYLTLNAFQPEEARALLAALQEATGYRLTADAQELLLAKAENYPQTIALSFVAAFAGWSGVEMMDLAEVLRREPWNDTFRKDVESICRDEVEKLAIFAMANIGRELCDLEEIVERVAQAKGGGATEVRDALHRIQNRHRLIKQPREGKFSFYHRNVGEYLHKNYASQFPPEWVAEGVLWDLQKMISEEVRIFERLGTLIGPDHLRIINRHRGRIKLAEDALALILLSALLHDADGDYWLKRLPELRPEREQGFIDMLGQQESLAVRTQVVRALGAFGTRTAAKAVERVLPTGLPVEASKRAEALEPLAGVIGAALAALQKCGAAPPTERLADWIFAGAFCGHDVTALVRLYPAAAARGLDPLTKELQAKNDFCLLKSQNLSAILGAWLLIDTETAVRAAADRHSAESERGEASRNRLAALRSTVAADPSNWLHWFREVVRRREWKPATRLAELLDNSLSKDTQKDSAFVLAVIESLPVDVDAEQGKQEYVRDLKKVAELFDSRKDSANHRRLLIQIGKALRQRATAADRAEAISTYVKLKDPEAVTQLVEEVRQALSQSADTYPAKEVIQDCKHALAGVEEAIGGFADRSLVALAAELTHSIIRLTGRRKALLDPLHEQIVKVYARLLRMDQSRDRTVESICAGLSELRGNALLQTDLQASVVLARLREGEQTPVPLVGDLLHNYEEADAVIDDLTDDDAGIKADLLFRFFRLCVRAKPDSAPEVSRRARNAYRYAAVYYDAQGDKFYDPQARCRAMGLFLEWDNNLQAWPDALFKAHGLHYFGYLSIEDLAFALAGRTEAFLTAFFSHGGNRDDIETAWYTGRRWFDEYLAAENQPFALICLGGIATGACESNLFEKELLPILLPMLLQDDTEVKVRETLLATGDYYLAKLVADELLETGYATKALPFCRLFLTEVDDEEWRGSTAVDWLRRAIELGDRTLVDCFWDDAAAISEYSDFKEKFIAPVVAVLLKGGPIGDDCRERLAASEDAFLLRNVIDALVSDGNLGPLPLLLLAYFCCADAEEAWEALSEWLDAALEREDAGLAVLCLQAAAERPVIAGKQKQLARRLHKVLRTGSAFAADLRQRLAAWPGCPFAGEL